MNAEREAWREISMMKYQLSGDILKAVDCADELVSKLKRFFRHEAAEEIRTEADDWDGWPEKQSDMKFAACLIDPEVRS